MAWRDAQRRQRERHWPAFDRLLGALPPYLFEQVKLLEYDLALRYSPTGQFRDVFLGPGQFPLLSIGGWLIEDLALSDGRARADAERRLFIAAVLMALRTHAIHAIVEETSFYDAEHLALVQYLSERTHAQLSVVASAAPPSSAQRDAIAVDGLEAMLAQRWLRRSPVPPDEPELYLNPRWARPGRVLALAALEHGRQARIGPAVGEMLDALADAFEIVADVSTMHTDLLTGRPTYPIAVVARAAGLPLTPWPDPTVVLGALVVTGSLAGIIETAIARIHGSRRIAGDLGLASFAEYLVDVEEGMAERGSRPARHDLAPDASTGKDEKPPAPRITLVQPTVAQAIGMAEGYLLSDLTFRESWETHREGMFGSPVVASRFPAGLILEILCAHGHGPSVPVEAFLDFVRANNFRYYDHPWSAVDSDTVGISLRLAPYVGATPEWDEAARTVLACLERDVAASGGVPVWITDCEGSPRDRPFMFDLGARCGTVAAHLLLGLMVYAPDRYSTTIERAGLELLGRIRDVGLAANVNYPRAYALAKFSRLATMIEEFGSGSGLGSGLVQAAGEARRVLIDELDRAVEWRVTTPQQAALLMLACLALDRLERVDPRWAVTMLKGQRSDGSWVGEPFAAAPNRGLAVSWYSSTQLTSALCFDALVRSRAAGAVALA